MTKPEDIEFSEKVIRRSQMRGAQSLQMYEAARKAIEDTRQLLRDVAAEQFDVTRGRTE
ncbi:MAG: hypothetical protein AAF665_06680 [Pseudomonadota bacterium]